MKVKIEMNMKNIMFIVIIVICIFSLSYGIYYQIFIKPNKNVTNVPPDIANEPEDSKFDELFDNKFNSQDFQLGNYVSKLDSTKDLVYTTYTLNEIYEGKYEIHASIPVININSERVIQIDKEIVSIFYDKLKSIINNANEEDTGKSIYTVTYTSYLNENILSLVIKANLKEGDNAQRVIIKSYTYNISTNQDVDLAKMIEIKEVKASLVESQIKNTIEDAINYSQSLTSLGYDSYKRNIKSDMYTIEKSNNYFLGPNEGVYIIYAYGNTSFTTERDIVYIK